MLATKRGPSGVSTSDSCRCKCSRSSRHWYRHRLRLLRAPCPEKSKLEFEIEYNLELTHYKWLILCMITVITVTSSCNHLFSRMCNNLTTRTTTTTVSTTPYIDFFCNLHADGVGQRLVGNFCMPEIIHWRSTKSWQWKSLKDRCNKGSFWKREKMKMGNSNFEKLHKCQ